MSRLRSPRKRIRIIAAPTTVPLARIIDADDKEEIVVSAKESDVGAAISAKPKPSYTREARRNGVQGFVTLKVLLSARGKWRGFES